MSVLVLKKWLANNHPVDQEGNYVVISGRQSGVIAWVLSCFGVDPITTLKVSAKRIDFQRASLSGSTNRVIPLQGVCSTYYGYHKPWIRAWVLFLVVLVIVGMMASVSVQMGLTQTALLICCVGLLVALGIASAYYVFNRTVTFGFVENSGLIDGIMFKRSVIEGVDVSELQARYASDLTQAMIERTLNNGVLSAPREGQEFFEASASAPSTDEAEKAEDGADSSAGSVAVEHQVPAQIGFSCPECGKFFEGPGTLAGTSYTCPECHTNFHIH